MRWPTKSPYLELAKMHTVLFKWLLLELKCLLTAVVNIFSLLFVILILYNL